MAWMLHFLSRKPALLYASQQSAIEANANW